MITSPSSTAKGSSPTRSRPRVTEGQSAADLANHFRLLRFPAFFKKLFQLRHRIKMIFNRVLTPSRHENYIFDSRIDALLHRVLDQRLVHHPPHLFWHRPRRPQETRNPPPHP